MSEETGIVYEPDMEFKEIVIPLSQLRDTVDQVREFLRQNIGHMITISNHPQIRLQSVYFTDDTVVLIYSPNY